MSYTAVHIKCNEDLEETVSFLLQENGFDGTSYEQGNLIAYCNSGQFNELALSDILNQFGLKGFYSGMFISEVGEAYYCGLPGMSQEIVDESNYGFCNIIAKYINEDKELIHENVKNEYGLIAETNPVALYNNNRLYKS